MGLGVGIAAGHSWGCKCIALCTGLDAAYSPARRRYPVDRNNSLVVFEAEEAFRRAGASTSTFKGGIAEAASEGS